MGPSTSIPLRVSVLFNEPKLLKYGSRTGPAPRGPVSVLFNEPKLLKSQAGSSRGRYPQAVSVLFNEPKLLKFSVLIWFQANRATGFSALQRAEIAEIAR